MEFMIINNRSSIDKINTLSPQKAEKTETQEGPKDEVTLSGRGEKEWTLLFYLDGNSNLSRASLYKLRSLEKTGSDENMNIVAQVSRPKQFVRDLFTGDWSGTRRYYVTQNPSSNEVYNQFHLHNGYNKGKAMVKMMGNALEEGKEKGIITDNTGPIGKSKFLYKATKNSPFNSVKNILKETGEIHSELISEEGKAAMSSPETLRDFLEWGMKNYPAKHYMVVIQGHGTGAEGVLGDKDGKMSLPIMENTLMEVQKDTGVKPDILFFDACLMGGAEVAYQMKDTADIMLASQEVERGFTLPYQKPMEFLSEGLQKGPVAPGDVAKQFVETAKNNTAHNFTPTMAATDLKETKKFGKALDEFSKALGNADEKYGEKLDELITSSQHFNLKYEGEKTTLQERLSGRMNPSMVNSYVDLYDFASGIAASPDIDDKDLKKSASDFLETLSRTIIANETTGENYKNAHGLSIFLPENPEKHGKEKLEKYKGLALSLDTGWDEFFMGR